MSLLGGDPPKVGSGMCTGFKKFGTLQIARVVGVAEDKGLWFAIVRYRRHAQWRWELVDSIKWHVGLWRPVSRRSEQP